MPLTAKERALAATGAPCPCNAQMFVAYLNVLLDRAPDNRLTLEDPDIQELLGWKSGPASDPPLPGTYGAVVRKND